MENILRISLLSVLLYLGTKTNSLPFEQNSTVAENTTATNKYRLPNDTVPIHYNVKLHPNIISPQSQFEGEVSVLLKVLKPTSEVVLNSGFLKINESATTLRTDDGGIVKPREHYHDADTEMLHLRFENDLGLGVYTLRLKFTGTTGFMRGLYNSYYEDDDKTIRWLTLTRFQLRSARAAFPCWDEPAIKATFNISVKHDANYTALSNMPEYAIEIDDVDGKTWTHFQKTPIMSTNILGLVVADYGNLSNSDGTIRIWTRRNAINHANYFLEIAEKASGALTEYLNSTVRVPKMDHVTIPQYPSRATENWGVIVYGERALLHNKDEDALPEKMANILTCTHELAHQWFGNLVSPSWWKYIWMSEGMVTFLSYYVTDRLFENWNLMEEFVVQVQQLAAFGADDRGTHPMNKDYVTPLDFYSRDNYIIYRKSAAVLRMLMNMVSEDVFRAGLIKYIDKHEYRSVTSDDLWQAMEEALNESDLHGKKFNVKKVMDTWVEQSGYPVVVVTRNYTTGKTMIHQELSAHIVDVIPRKWWIPLNYATKSNPDFSSTLPTLWLSPVDEFVEIDGTGSDDWLIVNLQESGYYRVNYDQTNWRRIAKYLNSDDFTKVHVLNRAQIIDDAYEFMRTKKLNPLIFVEITRYLSREANYIPWVPTFRVLTDLGKYMRHPGGGEILKPYLLNLMKSIIKNVGYDELPGDSDYVKLKRLEVLNWACRLGDEQCINKAADKLNAYLESAESDKIPPDLREWIFCNGLRHANQSVWNAVFDLQNKKLTYRDLGYLRCSDDPAIIENYFNFALSNSSAAGTTATDIFTFVTADNPSIVDFQVNFLIKNWDKIQSVTVMPHIVLNDLINKVNTRDQLDKLRIFAKNNRIIMPPNIFTNQEKYISKKEAEILKIRYWLQPESMDSDNEISTINYTILESDVELFINSSITTNPTTEILTDASTQTPT